jgi:hypothetical protein
MLGAKDEFRIYLLMYAKRLGAEGLRLKVEELLRTLIGGIISQPDQADGESTAATANAVEGRNWQEDAKMICGWPREELLKDVVLLLGESSLSLVDETLLTVDQGNIETCSGSPCHMPKCWAFSTT